MVKAETIVLFLGVLLCHHFIGGEAQQLICKLSDIHISTAKTGRYIGGQPEHEVTIENQCSCPMYKVTLRCDGLPSVEPVDATVIRPVSKQWCIVANGWQLVKGSPVTFMYAWRTPVDFAAISARLVYCLAPPALVTMKGSLS